MFESIGDTTTRTYTYEDNFFSLVVFTSVYLLAALAIAYTVESLFTEASYGQVWSLTQFYSLSFFFCKKCVTTQPRYASAEHDCVVGLPQQAGIHLASSLYLGSSRISARGEIEGP